MPFEQARQIVQSMGHHSNLSFESKVTHSGWKDVAVSWILTEMDFIVPVDVQKGYIELIEKEGNKKVDVHVLKAGHAPNASVPGELAEVLVKIFGARE